MLHEEILHSLKIFHYLGYMLLEGIERVGGSLPGPPYTLLERVRTLSKILVKKSNFQLFLL